MTIQQTIEIPVSRRVHFDVALPQTARCGKTSVIMNFPSIMIHEEPPTQKQSIAIQGDSVDASNPPMLDEIAGICDFAKTLPGPEGVYQCDEILDAAAETAEAGQAREFRLMAAKIRYHLSHPELWPESVRTVRAMRDEWDDPWERERNG